MAAGTTNAEPPSSRAPKHLVPDRVAMNVEHPCIVRNMDKAVEMIGGTSAIARSLKAGPDVPLSLRFNVDDPDSRPIVSIPKTTNNILMQVTVPRRTGRKRKRGTSGPFIEDNKVQTPAKDAQYPAVFAR